MGRPDPFAAPDLVAAEGLVAQVLAGEADAWPRLIAWLHPRLDDMTRTSRFLGSLRESHDHRQNVVVAVLEKLARQEHRGLRTFLPWREAHAGKTLADWLRIVTANVAREYVERTLGGPDRDDGAKRLLHTLASALRDTGAGFRPAVTDAQTVRQILEYAGQHLGGTQLAALSAWLAGADFGEIAAELGLADAAERHLALDLGKHPRRRLRLERQRPGPPGAVLTHRDEARAPVGEGDPDHRPQVGREAEQAPSRRRLPHGHPATPIAAGEQPAAARAGHRVARVGRAALE
jgi:hypothetical protein